MSQSESRIILKLTDGNAVSSEDHLVVEEPMEIRVRGHAISITMRTPGHDAELAIGFLLSEGIIQSADDILKIEPCQRDDHQNSINVLLAPLVPIDLDKLTRHVFASSSCGICGKASIESIQKQFPPLDPTCDQIKLSPEMIQQLPEKMRSAQPTFDLTGGLHAAAIFDIEGNLICLREDVGRHNAVDKVLGYCAMNNLLPLKNHILLVSGRTSFEIMQKSLAAGIPIVASVSAPSSIAVDFANENKQTLIGFVREKRMNIYTHAHRVARASIP